MSYRLVVPSSAPKIPPGTRATVMVCPDDLALVGLAFVVTGALFGSHRFERDLLADLDLDNQGVS